MTDQPTSGDPDAPKRTDEGTDDGVAGDAGEAPRPTGPADADQPEWGEPDASWGQPDPGPRQPGQDVPPSPQPGAEAPGQQPSYDPGYPQPGYGQPGQGYDQPSYQQPGYGQGYEQPGYGQPPYDQPGYGQGYEQPSYQQPGYGQPAYPPAAYGQPAYGPPGYGYVDPQAKSKIAAGLLGIFLGGFGVHRFYLGYTTIGVIQIVVTILTCGLGSIWGFVEGILYLVGAGGWQTDAQGRPLKD